MEPRRFPELILEDVRTKSAGRSISSETFILTAGRQLGLTNTPGSSSSRAGPVEQRKCSEGGKAHSPESPPTLIPAQGRLQTQGAVTSGYSGAVPSQGQEPLTLPNLPWAHTWGLHSAPCLLYEQNSLRKHKLLKQFILRWDARYLNIQSQLGGVF